MRGRGRQVPRECARSHRPRTTRCARCASAAQLHIRNRVQRTSDLSNLRGQLATLPPLAPLWAWACRAVASAVDAACDGRCDASVSVFSSQAYLAIEEHEQGLRQTRVAPKTSTIWSLHARATRRAWRRSPNRRHGSSGPTSTSPRVAIVVDDHVVDNRRHAHSLCAAG